MGMPVRLSDELTELARRAAEEATRSLTAQVEHWARIGRAVEHALDHASLAALKSSGGNIARAFPDAGRRAEVARALLAAVRGLDRDNLSRKIASGTGPLYGIERAAPGKIVRYEREAQAPAPSVHEKPARYAAKRRKRA